MTTSWFTAPDIDRKAAPMPEGFQPNGHHLALATELGVDLEEEFSIFVDHHLSKGNKFKSWDRALNTWLRRERKFSRPNHPPSSVTPVLRPCPLGRCDGSGVRSSYFTPGKFVVCECDQKRMTA